MFENYENNAFDSFDADSFDAGNNFEGYDEYGQPAQAKKGYAVNRKTSQVTLNITAEAGSVKSTIELFNFLNSFTRITNATYGALTPFDPTNRDAANLNGLIYFAKDGSLICQDAGGKKITIQGTDATYNALFNMTSASNFVITKMRMTVTTDAQIDNSITHFRKTALGVFKQNVINPRSYFNPNQFQPKIIDIPLNSPIDNEHGLYMAINSGETVSISLFLKEVVRTTTILS
jgi:hypothetical protein